MNYTERNENFSDEIVLPLIEEQLTITKRTSETGVTRLEKHTEQRNETVAVPLTSVTWQIEHVPLDLPVSETPPVRQEGETTIFPIMEERVVITRQLIVTEEVRVTRVTHVTQQPVSYTLNYEVLNSERLTRKDTPNESLL